MVDIASLRAAVRGVVLAPGDNGFDELVAPWLQNHAIRPEVAVGASTASDVAEAVKFASANGLPLRIQATGHGADQPVTDGVLVVTKALDKVGIDATNKTATIGAGVVWKTVVAEAGEHDLAPISGSSETVGAVGFLLGGGFGPLVRSHGFGSDSVLELEVVTAEGKVVRASQDAHPDLFWALRGGKGGLGVVTEVQLALVELRTLYGGALMFDAPHIETALRAWLDYTKSADARVSTSAAILRMPDLPALPEPLRGRTLLAVRFAFPGASAEGERLAAPLRAMAPVYLDRLAEIPASKIGSIHEDPPNPTVGFTVARMLGHADGDFATKLLEHAGAQEKPPFVAVELRHLGGRAAVDVPEGSATSNRAAAFALTLVGVPDRSLFEKVLPDAAARLFDAVSPWVSRTNNVNFAGRFASRAEYENAWTREQFARLAEIRKRYDPKGVFAYGVEP